MLMGNATPCLPNGRFFIFGFCSGMNHAATEDACRSFRQSSHCGTRIGSREQPLTHRLRDQAQCNSGLFLAEMGVIQHHDAVQTELGRVKHHRRLRTLPHHRQLRHLHRMRRFRRNGRCANLGWRDCRVRGRFIRDQVDFLDQNNHEKSGQISRVPQTEVKKKRRGIPELK